MKYLVSIFSTVLVFSLFLLTSSCVGTDEAGGTDGKLQAQLRRGAQVFEEARNDISKGTPASIERGLRLLEEENLHSTERGAELAFAALSIYRIVYPYLSLDEMKVILPTTSVYRELVEKVETGVYPQVEGRESDFMTLLLSSLTLITSENNEVISRAQETVSQLSEVNPNSPLVQYLRALVYRQEKEEGKALDLFKRIADQAPSCYPALLGAVELSEQRGRSAEAAAYVEILLEGFPWRRRVLRSTIEVFISLGRNNRADTLLSSALSLYPEDVELLLLRAVLLEKRGDLEKAMQLVRGFEGEYGEMAETRLVRGRVALREERYSDAESIGESGISLYPEVYEFYLLRFSALTGLQRGEEAFRLLSETWRERIWNMDLLSSLLDLSVRLEKWEEAEGYLLILLDYSSDDYGVLRHAVELYRWVGQNEEAVDYAEKLVRLYPERNSAITIYLDLLISMGREERVREYIEMRMEETESSEVRSLLFLYLSEVQPREEAKIESLQSALYENMQNTRALIRISELYRQRGETAKAARYLRQAVASRPEDEDLRRRLRNLEAGLE